MQLNACMKWERDANIRLLAVITRTSYTGYYLYNRFNRTIDSFCRNSHLWFFIPAIFACTNLITHLLRHLVQMQSQIMFFIHVFPMDADNLIEIELNEAFNRKSSSLLSLLSHIKRFTFRLLLANYLKFICNFIFRSSVIAASWMLFTTNKSFTSMATDGTESIEQ